jgi:hypothetical protein
MKVTNFKIYLVQIFPLVYNNKLRAESTRKKLYANVYKNEIHTHACQFLNIFLLKHANSFQNTCPRKISTRTSDFCTQNVISTCISVILTHSSPISTRRVCFSPATCNFDSLECHFHTHKCDLETHEYDLDTKTCYCNAYDF